MDHSKHIADHRGIPLAAFGLDAATTIDFVHSEIKRLGFREETKTNRSPSPRTATVLPGVVWWPVHWHEKTARAQARLGLHELTHCDDQARLSDRLDPPLRPWSPRWWARYLARKDWRFVYEARGELVEVAWAMALSGPNYPIERDLGMALVSLKRNRHVPRDMNHAQLLQIVTVDGRDAIGEWLARSPNHKHATNGGPR